MATPLLIANWKMYFRHDEAIALFQSIQNGFASRVALKGVVCAPYPFLVGISKHVNGGPVSLGAQNCFYEREGAFTGEVSCEMLRGVVTYVIVGHSERREYFGETDDVVARKVETVLASGMKPIVCIGERPEEYTNDQTYEVVKRQLDAGLRLVPKHRRGDVVLAYEPLWAISTMTDHPAIPTEEEIVSMGLWLRKYLVTSWGGDVAETVSILYGGSVDRTNVQQFVGPGKMDGALVGSASRRAAEFCAISEVVAESFDV